VLCVVANGEFSDYRTLSSGPLEPLQMAITLLLLSIAQLVVSVIGLFRPSPKK